jgi:hypothetical protein
MENQTRKKDKEENEREEVRKIKNDKKILKYYYFLTYGLE